MRLSGTLTTFAGLAWALAETPAVAAEPAHTRVHLIFERADSCPTRADFESEVAARLGYSPFDKDAMSTASVALEKEESRAHATLHVAVVAPEEPNAIGPREPPRLLNKIITSEKGDCAEVMRSAAASLAIFLDPLFAAPRKALSERASTDPPRVVTPPPTPSLVHALIQGEASSSLGLTPSLSIGASVHAGFRRSAWILMLGASAETSLTSRQLSGADVRASLLAAEFAACLTRAPFIACGDVSVGRYRAVAENDATALAPNEANSASTIFPMAGLRAGIALPLSQKVMLWVTPRFRVPFTEVTLRRAGAPIWSTAPLSVGLAAGVSWSD